MHREELEQAVCAQPDDDSLRLAYAVHVSEAEPERAEFIRLQLTRADDELGRYKRQALPSAREVALWHRNAGAWLGPLKRELAPSPHLPHGGVFVRGFLGHVRLSVEGLVTHGAQLIAKAPIQHLDVAPGELPLRSFEVVQFAQLDSLSLAGLKLDDDAAVAIAACATLSRVTWLDLSNNRLTRRGVESLARAAHLGRKRIVLTGNPCDPVEHPVLDWDGSTQSTSANGPTADLERVVGRRVPWFHVELEGFADRYCAKHFVA